MNNKKNASTSVYVLGVRNNFRGEHLVNALNSFGIKSNIIWGPSVNSDFSNISSFVNQDFCRFTIRRQIKLTEVACTLGHLRMYQEFQSSQDEWGFFLEDDAILVKDISKILESLQYCSYPVQIFVHDGPGTDLRISDFRNKKFAVTNDLVRYLDPNYGAYGYILNRKAVNRILDGRTKDLINTPDWPYMWPTDIRYYKTHDVYVSHPLDETFSIIGERINSRNSIWYQIPNPIRLLQGIHLGLPIKHLIHKEIFLKFHRVILQIKKRILK
jgi:GR25 family glycosyltransferase involved in LPS biosynthesis